MSAKHTPVPWKVYAPWLQNMAKVAVTGADNRVDIYFADTTEETIANAHLNGILSSNGLRMVNAIIAKAKGEIE